MLGHLRRTRPPVATGLEELLPVVSWVTGKQRRGDTPRKSATAETGSYRLLVVEMREAFMADKPLHAPKISWAIYYGSGKNDALMGAAAPTFEDAKAHAELALRVRLGARSEG